MVRAEASKHISIDESLVFTSSFTTLPTTCSLLVNVGSLVSEMNIFDSLLNFTFLLLSSDVIGSVSFAPLSVIAFICGRPMRTQRSSLG